MFPVPSSTKILMQADFAIELGADDEVLEIPWSSPDGSVCHFDLRNRPENLSEIKEASQFPELAEFLAAVNSHASVLATVKCDVWTSKEMNPEEDVFNAQCKFGSYVDLLFADAASRFSFPAHEKFAARMTELLKRVPDIPASADFLVRRCYYHPSEPLETRDGFYITAYLFGYGSEEAQARQQWGIGMKLVENAIRQISAEAK